MRLGCGGCLMVPMVLALTAAVGAAAWTTARLFHQPDVPALVPTAAESRRAQQRLFEILRRPPRSREPAAETVTFTEREVNGLVSNHLVQVGGLAARNAFVRLVDANRVDIHGSLPLADMLDAAGLAVIGRALPAGMATRPMWWRLTTHLRTASGSEGRRWLNLDVDRLTLGDQPVPVALTRLLLPPRALDLLRLELPAGIHSVTVESGRVVVRLGSSP